MFVPRLFSRVLLLLLRHETSSALFIVRADYVCLCGYLADFLFRNVNFMCSVFFRFGLDRLFRVLLLSLSLVFCLPLHTYLSAFIICDIKTKLKTSIVHIAYDFLYHCCCCFIYLYIFFFIFFKSCWSQSGVHRKERMISFLEMRSSVRGINRSIGICSL